MTICIVDTPILVELLNIPGRADAHDATLAEFVTRQEAAEEFILSIAVLIETGNFVAQIPDGNVRRRRAETFVEFAKQALDGMLPFVATDFPTRETVASWLQDFPDRAMTGLGLADRSLIGVWKLYCELQDERRVYIWSLDKHLRAHDRQP